MAVQFQHILAGERMRAGEKQQQPLVDDFAIVRMEWAVMSMTRRRFATAEGDGDCPGARAGYTDDSHASPAGSGGDGGDGVASWDHAASFLGDG